MTIYKLKYFSCTKNLIYLWMTIKKNEGKILLSKVDQRKLTKVLFGIYLLFLVWTVIFKMQFSLNDLPNFQSVNLVPLEGTTIVDGHYDYVELGLNVLIFIPFGLYISQIKPKMNVFSKTLIIAATSLVFELLQYVFVIGGTDVTDLIGNTLGGIVGIILYWILSKVFKGQSHKLINWIALVGTIITVVLAFIFRFT